ncbi:hypothetical protein LCGC14_2727980 [marine sediment metagenome]|uniref:Uncharacterized protein n=1 Tax=marine sediment metagenome TaxID=412755 RepID=A0A0F9BH73_9ZZZZ
MIKDSKGNIYHRIQVVVDGPIALDHGAKIHYVKEGTIVINDTTINTWSYDQIQKYVIALLNITEGMDEIINSEYYC